MLGNENENKNEMLQVSIVNKNVALPTRKTEFSVGFDLVLPNVITLEAKWDIGLSWEKKYHTDCPTILLTKRIYKIGLGLHFGEDHDRSVWCRLATRSSLSDKMTLLGGTIDGDYPDEWILKLRCDAAFEIRPGMAIAQAIFERRAEVSGLPTLAVPRTGGFGSTDAALAK